MITLIIITTVLLIALVTLLVIGLPILVVVGDLALGLGTIALVVFIFKLPGKIAKAIGKKKDNK